MITQLDFAVLDWIQANMRCALLDWLMPIATALGTAGIIWIALLVVFLFVKKRRDSGIEMAAGLICGLLVTNLILKNLVARARPCWLRPEVSLLASVPTDYSFPSGHATSCFCCAVILMHHDRRFGIPALILAVVISFSRMYLYLHFPSDVIAGAALGSLIAVLIIKCMKQIRKPRSSN